MAFLIDQHIVSKDVNFGYFECFSRNNSDPITSWATLTLMGNNINRKSIDTSDTIYHNIIM